MRALLRRLALRVLFALALLVIVSVPWPYLSPPPIEATRLFAALIVLGLVCSIGKLLYDTLFFDHYRP